MSLPAESDEIAAALQALAAALEDTDPTAWVRHYTEDAVFDGGGEAAFVGRQALLDLSRSMRPMRAVALTPLRTEASGDLAVIWFTGSWRSGPESEAAASTQVRGLLVMRREADGVWRVAFERIG